MIIDVIGLGFALLGMYVQRKILKPSPLYIAEQQIWGKTLFVEDKIVMIASPIISIIMIGKDIGFDLYNYFFEE